MEMPKELQGLVEMAAKKLQPTDAQRLQQLKAARQIGDARVATFNQVRDMVTKELETAQTQVKCLDYEIQALTAKMETAVEKAPADGQRDTVPTNPEVDGPLKED